MNDTNSHTVKIPRSPFCLKGRAEDLIDRPDMNTATYCAFINRLEADRPSRELILSRLIHAR
jgi:hypothetical protein